MCCTPYHCALRLLLCALPRLHCVLFLAFSSSCVILHGINVAANYVPGDILLILGIGGVLDAWRRREMDILRLSNEEFEKLGVEEKKVMIASIMEDDRRIAERRSR